MALTQIMDSHVKSNHRRPTRASFNRPSAAIKRSSTVKSDLSKTEAKDQNSALECENISEKNSTAAAVLIDNPLLRKSSPMNPYNKIELSKMPVELIEIEKLTSIENKVQSPKWPVVRDVGSLKTPIESCSSRQTGTPNEDRAVQSTVIGLDGCCKETWKRKEFYYAVKARVERAVKRHKVFLIRGDLPKLAVALEQRGWLQKYESPKTRMLPYRTELSVCNFAKSALFLNIKNPDGSWNEKVLIYAFLSQVSPDFIWDCRNDFVEWDPALKSNVLLNRFERSSLYTSKLGMARILQEAHWFVEENIGSVEYPRSFNPSRESGAFLDDFRRTAVVGLLKWLVASIQNGQSIMDLDSQSIPVSRIEFALERCEEFLAEDDKIDQDLSEIPQDEWSAFLQDYSRVLHGGSGIASSGEDTSARLEKCYQSACVVLKKLKAQNAQYELDGMRNIWILKPSDLCCGAGIRISHSIEDIFQRVEAKPKDYFIIQKYIEKPLLIHSTKFDIRLWYLITSACPLTIWLFEEAFLRFSSMPYSYETYHEAIHLCNTAIQQKYDFERRRRRRGNLLDETTGSIRDQGWDCFKLNEYLKQQGFEGDPYYDKIYPKMSQAIVLTMLAAQDRLDRRQFSFELYGADFMVLQDLSVWLIEINTNPRMHPPSSRITQRLYDSVLESLVKVDTSSLMRHAPLRLIRQYLPARLPAVVMDLPLDPDADTGGFKLAYKQKSQDFKPYIGPGLFVLGKSMKISKTEEKPKEKPRDTPDVSKNHRIWTASGATVPQL